LAVAGGRLLVSTDAGVIYAFAEKAEQDGVSKTATEPKQEARQDDLATILPVEDPALHGRWVFQSPYLQSTTARDLTASSNVQIRGTAKPERMGRLQALRLGAAPFSLTIQEDHSKANLPASELTATAWVRIDKPLRWGGIIGAIQDNGSYERGWLLGYENQKFNFALAANDGGGRLTYLKGGPDFPLGHWCHVAGTYDGKQMRLYVHGRQVATSDQQKGDINYPPKAFYEIGAYHDDNERYPLTGMIHEVRVYSQALSGQQIRQQFESWADQFPEDSQSARKNPLQAGPWVEFDRGGQAKICWETAIETTSTLECRQADQLIRRQSAPTTTQREVRLSDLKHDRVYDYQISYLDKGKLIQSPTFQFDTFFNLQPGSADEFEERTQTASSGTIAETATEFVLTQAGSDRGICLVLGCDQGQWIDQLIRQSRFRCIVVDTDGERVARLRQRFLDSGQYGERVAVHWVDRFDKLPLPSWSANLIVSERLLYQGQLVGSAAETYRVLRPHGVLCLGQPDQAASAIARDELSTWFRKAGLKPVHADSEQGTWARLTRGLPTGAGQWTHLYGGADNSAFGGESLGGVSSAGELELRWIGRPGPRYQSDRGNRKPSPLSTQGRLFVQGWRRMLAVDAYNGSWLWSLEIPELQRFNMPRDCSNWCADNQHVYAAVRDRVWKVAAEDGSVADQFSVLSARGQTGDWDWGYVASWNDLLLGSAVRAGSAWTYIWGGADQGWYDAVGGPVTHPVCSDNLFALEKKSGKPKWSYEDGVVLNSSITIGAGRVYFVECRDEQVVEEPARRIGSPRLWQDRHLVALDADTGRKLWDRRLPPTDPQTVLYLAYAKERVAMVTSAAGQYNVHVVAADSGESQWQDQAAWPRNHHGGHISRPAIVENSLYVRPHIFDLYSGKLQAEKMPNGGCGTYACTAGALVFRDKTITLWDRKTGDKTSWNRLRPDCWLSTIPAGGMLLAPEGGGGCSCGSWMETSIGFAPVRDGSAE
jgi:outer membrane protein assembly factor BamB